MRKIMLLISTRNNLISRKYVNLKLKEKRIYFFIVDICRIPGKEVSRKDCLGVVSQ